MKRLHLLLACLALTFTRPASAQTTPALPQPTPNRNTILFIADGMRHSAINPTDAPTMSRLREEGVNFVNSHSLYPTFTMPNASAIATGHLLGDTGQFGNTLFLGFTSATGTLPIGTEDDNTLRMINDHYDNKNYLNETSLLATARAAGLHTAVIGKHGPAVLQDLTQNNNGITPATIIIDDNTGTRGSAAIPEPILAAARRGGIDPIRPPAASIPNVRQQEYLLNVALTAVLPTFLADTTNTKPFMLVFWSRDPDHSQHSQIDNRQNNRFENLGVGINGPTAKAAIKNADNTIAALLKYLADTDDPRHPGQKLAANTNVFITADHGFGTISRRDLSAAGDHVDNFASTIHYQQVTNNTLTEAELLGYLPTGFVAIDLAEELKMPLWDLSTAAQRTAPAGAEDFGTVQYARIDPHQPPETNVRRMFSAGGYSVLGGTGKIRYRTNPTTHLSEGSLEPETKIMTFGNGGTEAIYFPNARLENGKASAEDAALARQVVAILAKQKYVGAIFLDTDLYGTAPGALSLNDIGLKGTSQNRPPAILVSFATFSLDPANPLYTGVEIADTTGENSQGTHGTFARFDTFNNMIAIGPDFKKGLKDTDPISNADIAPTLAHLMGLKLPTTGKLNGRIIEEALNGGRAPAGATQQLLSADPTTEGFRTDLRLQILKDSQGNEYRYRTWAGTKGRVVAGEQNP